MLLGKERERADQLHTGTEGDPERLNTDMQWCTHKTFSDKYHGVKLRPTEQVDNQWSEAADLISRNTDRVSERQRRSSLLARVNHVKQSILPAIYYPCRYQAPAPSDLKKHTDYIQRSVNQSVLGRDHLIAVDTAIQSRENFGISHPQVHTQIGAEHASKILRMLTRHEHRPYHNFIRYQLKKHYGDLHAGDALLTSNYTYASITTAPEGSITETMRQTFAQWGTMPPLMSTLSKLEAAAQAKEEKERKDKQRNLPPSGAAEAAATRATASGQRTERDTPRTEAATLHPILYATARIGERPATRGLRATATRTTKRNTPKDAIMTTQVVTHAIELCADPHAAAKISRRHGLQPKILAIDTRRITDTVTVADTVRALTNTGVPSTSNAGIRALRKKSVLVIGPSGQHAHIPWHAVVGELDTQETTPNPRTTQRSTEEDRLLAATLTDEQNEAILEFRLQMERERKLRCAAEGETEDYAPRNDIWIRRQERSREEALETLLLHSAPPTGSIQNALCGRSTPQTEELAKRWASVGLRRVGDITAACGRRLMTTAELTAACTTVTAAEYIEIREALAADIELALTTGQANSNTTALNPKTHEWIRSTDARDCYARVESIAGAYMHARIYQRVLATHELRATGETRRLRRNATNSGWTRCAVRTCATTHSIKEKETPPGVVKGGTIALRKALYGNERIYVVSDSTATAPAEPERIAVTRPPTLHTRGPVRIADLSVKMIATVHIEKKFSLPTAFDPYNKYNHWANAYSGYSPEQYRERIALLSRTIRQKVIPPPLQDNTMRVMLSAIYTGPNKQKK